MGTTARGSKSFLSYMPEAAYGVTPVGNFNGLSFSSETLTGSINPVVSDEIQKRRSTPSARGGNIMTGGNIVCDFSPKRFAIWLAHLMGQTYTTTAIVAAAVANTTHYNRGDIVSSGANDYLCVVDGTTSGAAAADLTGTTLGERLESGTAEFVFFDTTATAKHKHVVKGDVDFLAPGLTIEKAVLGQAVPFYLLYNGGRINQLALSIPQEGIVKGTWDFLFTGKAAKSGASSAGVIVDVSEDPFVGFEAAVVINDGVRATMKDANFTISNNCETDDFRIGSRFRASVPPRRRELSGNMTAVFEDDTEYELFENEEKFSLAFQFYHADAFVEFLFPECKFFGDPSPKVAGGGTITSQFAFTAFQQDAVADIQITLKNTDAAYVVTG